MELVLIAKLEIELYRFMGEWLMFLSSEHYFCLGEEFTVLTGWFIWIFLWISVILGLKAGYYEGNVLFWIYWIG